MKPSILCSMLLILASPWTAPPAQAQWDVNESVSISEEGSEIEFCLVGDGGGGAFMAWSESVAGVGWRIFAQRSDAAGQLLWTPGGVDVAPGGYQPQLVLDGAGGVVILWRDWGIQAMRLDGGGQPMWPAPVELVSNDDFPTYGPAYASDGTGGAIATWDGPDHFTGNRDLFDVRAQRVSGDGQLPWGSTPVTVCGAAGYQSAAQVVADGTDGAFFAWRHEGATAEADVFAQRLDSTGNLLWATGGVPLCQATGSQEEVALHPDGNGGAIALWEDGRGSDAAIRAQRVDSFGQTMWMTDGVEVGSVIGPELSFRSAPDLAGGALVAWASPSPSTGPRKAQRIDASGDRLWSTDGVVIVNEDTNTFVPRVAPDGSGGAFLTWADGRREDCLDTYAQHLDSTGNHLWNASGVLVAAIEHSRVPYGVTARDGSTAIVLWADTGPVTGLPKRSDSTLAKLDTSSAEVVLSRVTSAGTGLVADCEEVTGAPDRAVSIAISNHPNPFNPRTSIACVLPVEGRAQLVVYDVAGRAVRTLLDGWQPAGPLELTWDGRDDRGRRVPSGSYHARLRVGGFEATGSMLLLK